MKHIISLMLVLTVAVSSFASVPPPVSGGSTGGTTTGGPVCWPPPCVPIDNGLIFLIIAGVALSAWKIYSLRKAQASKA